MAVRVCRHVPAETTGHIQWKFARWAGDAKEDVVDVAGSAVGKHGDKVGVRTETRGHDVAPFCFIHVSADARLFRGHPHNRRR